MLTEDKMDTATLEEITAELVEMGMDPRLIEVYRDLAKEEVVRALELEVKHKDEELRRMRKRVEFLSCGDPS